MYFYVLLAFCFIVPFRCDPIYLPHEVQNKPSQKQEPLNWPQRPSATVDKTVVTDSGVELAPLSPRVNVKNQWNPLEKNPIVIWPVGGGASEYGKANRDSQSVMWPEANQVETGPIWDGLSCPKGATGEFPYLPDCRRFINCWKGKGSTMPCAPGTLFNPKTLECDFPAKVSCLVPPSHYEGTATTYNNNSSILFDSSQAHRHRHQTHYHHHVHTYPGYHTTVKPTPATSGGRRFDDQLPDETATIDQKYDSRHAGVQPPAVRPRPSSNYPSQGFPANSRYPSASVPPPPDPNYQGSSVPSHVEYPTPYSPASSNYNPSSRTPTVRFPPESGNFDSSQRDNPKYPATPFPASPSYPPFSHPSHHKHPTFPSPAGSDHHSSSNPPNQIYPPNSPSSSFSVVPDYSSSSISSNPGYPAAPSPARPSYSPPPARPIYSPPPANTDFPPPPASANCSPSPDIPDYSPPPASTNYSTSPARPNYYPSPASTNCPPSPDRPDYSPLPGNTDYPPFPAGPNYSPPPASPNYPPFPASPNYTPSSPKHPTPPFLSRPDYYNPNPKLSTDQQTAQVPTNPVYRPSGNPSTPPPPISPQFWPSDMQPPSRVLPQGQPPRFDSYGGPITPDYPSQDFDTSSLWNSPPNPNGAVSQNKAKEPQKDSDSSITSRHDKGNAEVRHQQPVWSSGHSVQKSATNTEIRSTPRPQPSHSNRVAYRMTVAPSRMCPPGVTGMHPHPECKKYLSCVHGRTFVMNCSKGTRFHPLIMVCDHEHKVMCGEDGMHIYQIEDPNETEEDLTANPSEIVQEVEVGISRNGTGRDLSLDPRPEDRPTTPRYTPHPDYKIPGFFVPGTSSNASEPSGQLSEPGKTPKPSQVTRKPVTTTRKPTPTTRGPSQATVKPTPNSSGGSQANRTRDSHVFRPEEVKIGEGDGKSSGGKANADRQLLRLRGGPTHLEGFVEIQLSHGGWGVLCDQPSQWTIQEANIVCRHLGFDRGAEISWQGSAADESPSFTRIVSTDSVNCYGHEDSILDCTISRGKVCELEKDAVWVRCYGNPVSQCMPGETSFEGKCYSLVVPKEESPSELVGFSQAEAVAHCQQLGGHLLDITSQRESDYISEWLLKLNFVDSVMTSGVGVSVMGHALWIWEGSTDSFLFQNWWPGWKGGKGPAPKTETGRGLCVVIRRHYPCPEAGRKMTGEQRQCDSQYFFWDVEDCGSMSHQYPYVCERPADDIGCTVGNGAHYKGEANVTREGKYCLHWGTSEVLAALRYQISESDLKNKLLGHNYCRNVGGRELHPWCYTISEKGLNKELCDIPKCSKGIEKSGGFINYHCKPNEFSCNFNYECIPSVWVCNGEMDCSNGRDETDCSSVMTKFSKISKSRLIGHDIERFIQLSLYACAHQCFLTREFECKSFSYADKTQECALSDSNVGLSGSLAMKETEWEYYELNSKSLKCDGMFHCQNGKCINKTNECNGHNDCGDRSDEKNCTWLDLGIEIRLKGGTTPNEGLIEIKVLGEWGLVCDDQFDIRDAHVICRHIGYPLGASEVRKHSDFNAALANGSAKYFVDDLNCKGDETNITQCEHNGWGIHDCGPEEAAGLVCKIDEEVCGEKEWQCDSRKECIPIGFLCDNHVDCFDRSDEKPDRCNSSIEVRLVGPGRSDKGYEGRLEVRRFGVWGTVCDDDFGSNEAEVVCKALGYSGPAKAMKEAAFGPGNGVIWLDQVHCAGNEPNLHHCLHESWASTNCMHKEDVSISCRPRPYHQAGTRNGHPSKARVTLNITDILPSVCGVPPKIDVSTDFTPKVVSGFEATKGSYPWQASIRVKSVSGRSSHWCGAVVISKLHVLTAGHCVRDYIKSSYYIRAGDHDTERDEGSEQDKEIEEIWIHEDIDKETRLNNDIALVKIKAPGFTFDRWVSPACLPRKTVEYTPGRNCSISGWGSDGRPGSGFSRTLHATWLNIMSTDECRSKYVYGDDAVTKGMFCAGSLTGGSDSCQGDSGGPFLCLHQGHYTLFGITSWGHGCGRANSPGVYTKLTHYIEWMHDKILKSIAEDK